MTANQIMIPIALLGLAIWVLFLVLKARRTARENAQRAHRANAPDAGRDKSAVARSAMHGHGANGPAA